MMKGVIGVLLAAQFTWAKLLEPESVGVNGPHGIELERSKRYKPGTMTAEFVAELGRQVGYLSPGHYDEELITWSEHTNFYPVTSRDGLVLQGYSMLQAECSSKPLLFFGVGYTESTVKYSHVLNAFFADGYDVYSFDYRGQGFSEHTGWNEERDLRMNNLDNFDRESHQKSQDLVDFMDRIVNEDARRCGDSGRPEPVFVGNSMGGLIGYTTQRLYSDLSVAPTAEKEKTQNEGKLFSKLALIVPCIMPKGVSYLHRAFLMVMSYITPEWWQRSAPFIQLQDMDLDNHFLSHDKTFMSYWYTLRLLTSRWLISSGGSLNFTRWLCFTGAEAVLKGESEAVQSTDILVVMAEDDRLVEKSMVKEFFGMLTSPSATRKGKRKYVEIPNTYHEVWAEGPHVTNTILKEIRSMFGASL